MKKIIKLTESDVTKIVKKVIQEQQRLNEDAGQIIGGLAAGGSSGSAIGGVLGGILSLANGGGSASNKVKGIISLCEKSKSPLTTKSNQLADKIYDAIDGIGTDEKMVFQTLGQVRTMEEFCSVVKSYKSSYRQDLFSALDGDFDAESEWIQIMRPLRDLALNAKQTTQRPSTGQGGGGTRPSTGQGGGGTRTPMR